MRTSLARTISGTAIAAAAVLALAGPANAAPAHAPRTHHAPRVHTTLSIVESRNVIKAGQHDVISGRLASRGIGLGKHVVYLDRLVGKTFVAVQAEITGPKGGVSFTVRPSVTARYELVYRGNSTFAPTHSGVVTVKVIDTVKVIH
jgi:hypothetical protein